MSSTALNRETVVAPPRHLTRRDLRRIALAAAGLAVASGAAWFGYDWWTRGRFVETTNDVLRVYSPAGSALGGVQDLNTFFGYAFADNRSIPIGTAGRFGPFVTDPSCYFDPATQRWFVDILTLEVFSDSGDFIDEIAFKIDRH